MIKKIILVGSAILLILFCGRGKAAQTVQQAFLVQNSGWMEPFYTDKHSEFKPLIIRVIEAVTEPDESVSILSFNQSTPENKSPTVVYHGTAGAKLRMALGLITIAHKGAGMALADTDFNEAVYKTITGPFKDRPGIVWIFTNNKNSPNNSSETAKCNREFYNLVHSEPSITRSLAFPLSMPVKGNVYSANGLMIYALAYGREADSRLRTIASSARLKQVITQQPAQLKPLDKNAVQLIPKSVINAPNTSASLGADGKTIDLEINVSSHQPVVRIIAGLKNLFYPYRIVSATIRAEVMGKGWTSELSVSPNSIQELAPGDISDITLAIPIPAKLPGIWSKEALLDFGRRILISEVIRVRLEDQRLRIDDAFLNRMEKIFPGDPLPAVFVPPASIQASTETVPLLIRVDYPLLPLVGAIGSFIALLAAGLFLFPRIRSAGSYEIMVDGLTQRISLRRFDRRAVVNPAGQQVGVIRRGAGTPRVESVSSGHTLSLRV